MFADFLQENGGKVEDAWARFIRAHVRLGTGLETAGDVPTVQRFGKDYWLRQFAERLGFSAGSGAGVGEWQRGFPERLTADYPLLRTRWAELPDRIPFRQLGVEGIEDEAVEDLVQWPRLERLTTLELMIWDSTGIERMLSARGVAALATCPALRGLQSLSLAFLEVTERVADLILQSRCLSGVRNLTLRTGAFRNRPSWRVRDRLGARFGPHAVQ